MISKFLSSVFEVSYSHFSILRFLTNFRDFWVFVFGYRSQNENPEITENLYFLVYKLCFDHYFSCLSVKTDISKNRLNLIYSEVLKAFKTHCMTSNVAESFLDWCRLNSISTVLRATFSFQLLLELYSPILVLWRFCRISVISEFSFLGVKLKRKTRKPRKIFIFGLQSWKAFGSVLWSLF